jgi:hypothetical protein
MEHFSHHRHVKTRRGNRSCPGHCRWQLWALLAKTPCDCCQGFGPMHSASCAQKLEGPERKFQFFCLSFSLPSTSSHVFKIGTLVFQVITLAKRQHDIPLLVLCSGLNKSFFFYDYKCSFPEIQS